MRSLYLALEICTGPLYKFGSVSSITWGRPRPRTFSVRNVVFHVCVIPEVNCLGFCLQVPKMFYFKPIHCIFHAILGSVANNLFGYTLKILEIFSVHANNLIWWLSCSLYC